MSISERIKKLEERIAATVPPASAASIAELAEASREWEEIERQLRDATPAERELYEQAWREAYDRIFPKDVSHEI